MQKTVANQRQWAHLYGFSVKIDPAQAADMNREAILQSESAAKHDYSGNSTVRRE